MSFGCDPFVFDAFWCLVSPLFWGLEWISLQSFGSFWWEMIFGCYTVCDRTPAPPAYSFSWSPCFSLEMGPYLPRHSDPWYKKLFLHTCLMASPFGSHLPLPCLYWSPHLSSLKKSPQLKNLGSSWFDSAKPNISLGFIKAISDCLHSCLPDSLFLLLWRRWEIPYLITTLSHSDCGLYFVDIVLGPFTHICFSKY